MRFNRDFVCGVLVGASTLVVGLALGAAAAPGQDATKVVKTQRLEIVDEIGTALVVIGSQSDGGSVSVRDRFGKELATLGATESGGLVKLLNRGSGQKSFVATATNAGGRMQMYSASGSRIFDAASTRNGGLIQVGNARGGPAAVLSCTEAGRGKFSILGTSATPLVLLTATDADEGQIYTLDGQKRPLIALATTPEGPTLRMFNKNQEAGVGMMVTEQGEGLVSVFDKDGNAKTLP
jgi:hypothetical protein